MKLWHTIVIPSSGVTLFLQFLKEEREEKNDEFIMCEIALAKNYHALSLSQNSELRNNVSRAEQHLAAHDCFLAVHSCIAMQY
jgi:hypothetical protein